MRRPQLGTTARRGVRVIRMTPAESFGMLKPHKPREPAVVHFVNHLNPRQYLFGGQNLARGQRRKSALPLGEAGSGHEPSILIQLHLLRPTERASVDGSRFDLSPRRPPPPSSSTQHLSLYFINSRPSAPPSLQRLSSTSAPLSNFQLTTGRLRALSSSLTSPCRS